ncbi:MAG: D-aminoacyl-tRNA deacylase [Collinsella phocaeensis]|nr:D-tyrosyl-tRNA(Tyr) deacylase [Collinsella sp.]
MRALVQRVTRASVTIGGEVTARIGAGYLVLLGVGEGDTPAEAERLWSKLRDLRIMEDDEGRVNRSLMDTAGDVLVVSQFTLYANCRRGRRPSFTDAASPDLARELYEYFVELARRDVERVQTGTFAADMSVDLVNDGPFTVMLDTADL